MRQQRFLKRSGKSKKLALLLTSLTVILTVTAGGTIAYLFTQTSSITNIFKPGSVPTKIIEEFDGTVKEHVQIKNAGNVDAYIRAVIIVNWVDEAGNIHGTQLIDEDDYIMELNDGAVDEGDDVYWILKDNFYYWPKAVGPEGLTEDLIKCCKLKEGTTPPNGCQLSVEILAQSIQTVPDAAVIEAWGSTVAKDIYDIDTENHTD